MTRQRLEFLLRLLKANDLTEPQWTELTQAFSADEFRDLLTADILHSLKEKQIARNLDTRFRKGSMG